MSSINTGSFASQIGSIDPFDRFALDSSTGWTASLVRLPDGDIDIDHYQRVGRSLQGEAVRGSIRGLFRLIRGGRADETAGLTIAGAAPTTA